MAASDDYKELLVKLTVEATDATRKTREVSDALAEVANEATRTQAKLDEVNRRAASFSDGMGEGISKNTRFMLVNTANQIQDFVVQIDNGMGAMRALGQQLPQMLGGLGLIGGAFGVIASLAPAAFAFFDGIGKGADPIKAASEAMDQLNRATSLFDSLAKSVDIDKLVASFAKLTREAQQLSIASAEARRGLAFLANEKAQQELKNYATGLGALRIGIKGIRREIDDGVLQDTFGIGGSTGREMADILEKIEKGSLGASEGINRLNSIQEKGNDKFREARATILTALEGMVQYEKSVEDTNTTIETMKKTMSGELVPKPEKTRAGSAAQNDFNRLLKEYSTQLIKLNQGPGSVSVLTTLNEQYARGLVQLLPAELRRLQIIAQQIDSEKELQEIIKEGLKRDKEDEKVRSDAEAKINADWVKRIDEGIKAEADLELAKNKTALAIRDQISALEDSADPMRVYNREAERLAALLSKGLSWEAFIKGLEQAKEALDKGLGIEKTKEQLSEMQKMMNQLATQGVSGLADALVNADKSFSKFADNFLRQVAKMIIQTSLLQSLAGSPLGGILGFVKPGGKSSPGVQSGFMSREASPIPSLFSGAVGAPIVSAASQSSGVSVNVVNNAGAEIGVESRQNADGSTMIDILVERKVKGMIASGAMDRVMASTFGARRRGFA